MFQQKNNKRELILIHPNKTSDYLESSLLCVNDFFKVLRSTPELMYKIIKYANKTDFTSSFICFISMNFYNNILSSESYSIEFLKIIEHLLYDEISSLKKVSEFLEIFEKSNVFKLLTGLKFQKEIKMYFNLILNDIIENYENSEDNKRPLIFEIFKLENYITGQEKKMKNELINAKPEKRKELQKRQQEQINELNKMYKMKLPTGQDSSGSSTINEIEESDSNDNENSLSTYLIENLTKTELIDILDKKTDNINKSYIREKLSLINEDNYIFSNKILLDRVQKSKISEKILFHYQKNFNIVIDIINKIIKKFLETLHLIPKNIKYICKIIYNLLHYQFNGINDIEIYYYLSQFFLIFLFKDFFLNPDIEALITTIIISKHTKTNLNIIFDIWETMIKGKFYTVNSNFCDFTPFNWFFIESINNIFELCKKILNDVELPKNFISSHLERNNINICNNGNSNKISFSSYSVCYNIYDLMTFIDIIEKNSENFFENENNKKEIEEFAIIFKNLKTKYNIFQKLQEKDKNYINYYLYYEVICSKKFQDIFFAIINNNNFRVEGKDEKTDENKILLLENYLCDFLSKSPNLNLIELPKNIDKNNIFEIINALKNHHKKILLNNTEGYENIIPYEWYSNSLLICLSDYNNKELLTNIFQSLKNGIISSMNLYNFGELSQVLESLKNTRSEFEDYKDKQEKIKLIIINNKITQFIENEIIEIEIKFRYNNTEKLLNIIKKEDCINNKFQYLDEFLNETKKDKTIYCKNIPQFIEKFPNLSLLHENTKIDVFLIEKEINLRLNLIYYFRIIKEHIDKKFDEEEHETVYKKIKKTILIRIYDKVFPSDPDNDDTSFYYKSISLAWIEPKHLNQPNIFFDNFLPITTKYFKQINNEKSPSGKLEIIGKIFEAINNVLIFNKGGNYSTDDIAPIFEYALIKSQPERLSSNLKYLHIFMSQNGSDIKKMQFDYLKNNMNQILNANYNNFSGVTKEEFDTKCRNKLNEEFSKT